MHSLFSSKCVNDGYKCIVTLYGTTEVGDKGYQNYNRVASRKCYCQYGA